MILKFTDNSKHSAFCPLALTRPIADLRFGILTIQDTWSKLISATGESVNLYYETESYLNGKFPNIESYDFLVAGNFKPASTSANALLNLQQGENLIVNGQWLASRGTNTGKTIEIEDSEAIWLENIWDLFQQNAAAIALDFHLLTIGRNSQPISTTNQVLNPEQVFIEEGAKVECTIINASSGPVYIGKDAEVMEGSMIRGPFALGEHATIKMGAKIYGPTTVGTECKIGGEVSNCIFYAYSNKGHDGFIGNSLIGEWCNLGADTNSSNLKNNYGLIKLYDFNSKSLVQTPLQFCGLLMGDHSKTGINTMLNTATTIGVSANVYGAEFPPKYIPSFAWGPKDKFQFDKALEVSENMMKRRNLSLSDSEKEILEHLFKTSSLA
ncbi:MAG: GlmU family protein [Crocinitomicaceae bacterium]